MPRIEFTLDSGGTVLVEGHGGTGVAKAGRPGLEKATATLRASLTPVLNAATDMFEAVKDLPSKPDEVEVEFGVDLDASVGAVIAGASAAAHLTVRLHWSPDRGETSPAAQPDASPEEEASEPGGAESD